MEQTRYRKKRAVLLPLTLPSSKKVCTVQTERDSLLWDAQPIDAAYDTHCKFGIMCQVPLTIVAKDVAIVRLGLLIESLHLYIRCLPLFPVLGSAQPATSMFEEG